MNTQKRIGDGGPAFPTQHVGNGNTINGMTLRDWFAGQDLVGVEAAYDPNIDWPGPLWCNEAASHCYEIADAMLKAREARP